MAASSLRFTRQTRGVLLSALCACGVLLVAGSARTDGPPLINEYVVQDVGFTLPPSSTIQWFPAINSRGQVAGGTAVVSPGPTEFHAARTNGALTAIDDLGVLGGTYSNGFGINVNSQTQGADVVGESIGNLGNPRAFRFSDTTQPQMQDLGTLGGASAHAFKINSNGEIAGTSDYGGARFEAFLFDGSIQPLGFLSGGQESGAHSINEATWVVGESIIDLGMLGLQKHAFLWTPFTGMQDLGTLGNGDESVAWDVNDADPVQIVGQSTTEFGTEPHAFRHTVTPLPSKIDLGTLSGDNASIAYAVNDLGVVVGTSYVDDPPIVPRAFIWQDVNGNGASDDGEMRDLNDLLPPSSGWVLYAATDINNVGQIVGYGTHNGQPAVFRLSPPDNGAPSVSPFNFPLEFNANGGVETICANVDEDIALDHVKAIIQLPGGGTAEVPMTLIGGNLYCGFFNADSNSSSSDETYSVDVEAEDDAGHVVTKSGSDFVVHPNNPPDVLDCSISPLTRTAPGGDFLIRAEVTDDTGLLSVGARITLPDNSVVTLNLDQEGSSDFYSNTYTAPANNTNADQTYHVDIRADDNFDETTLESCGDFKVLKNAPPVITNCGAAPASRLATGGLFTISADVTDDVQVKSVTANITLPGQGAPSVDVTLNHTTGNTYSGTYNAPANNTNADQSYGLQITATDNFNASSVMPCTPFKVLVNAPPVITNPSITPASRNAAGGSFHISANVTDDISVSTVIARITKPDSNTVDVPLALQSGSLYAGDYTAPGNFSNGDETYTAQIRATDGFNALSTLPAGSFTVLKNVAPIIVSCSVTPPLLPHTGGVATVTAHLQDETGIDHATVAVTGPGVNTTFNLSKNSGTVLDGVWTGTTNLPANVGINTTHFQFSLTAVDDRNASTTQDCGEVVVEGFFQDTEPPVIHSCSVSTHFIQGSGNLVVTANVTDNIGVNTVVAHLEPPKSSGFDTPMPNIGGNQYQATIPLTSGGGNTQIYTVTILATDFSNNHASMDCSSVRVASSSEGVPGRVQVDPRKLVYGKVNVNANKVLSFTVKHLGGSDLSVLAFQVGGAKPPFEILDGLGAFGTNSGGFITLTPGQKKTIRVRFHPTAVGHYIQHMTVLTNDPDQPNIDITLDGRGCTAH